MVALPWYCTVMACPKTFKTQTTGFKNKDIITGTLKFHVSNMEFKLQELKIAQVISKLFILFIL